MFSIAVISPCAALGRAIAEQGEAAGVVSGEEWRVSSFASVEDFRRDKAVASPDAILFDSALKSCSPREGRLFFVISEDDGEEDKNEDEVCETFRKPLRLGHLLARMSFHLRYMRQNSRRDISLGGRIFSPSARRISGAGEEEEIRLTDMESRLLETLCRREAPASRDELLAEVWGYGAGTDTHTVETYIYRLRRKLKREGGEDPFASTPEGYRMNPAWLA